MNWKKVEIDLLYELYDVYLNKELEYINKILTVKSNRARKIFAHKALYFSQKAHGVAAQIFEIDK